MYWRACVSIRCVRSSASRRCRWKACHLRANGGGDTPEAVGQALFDAVSKMSWSTEQQTYKTIFLVGDAPSRGNYVTDIQIKRARHLAAKKDIFINAIQAGSSATTKQQWRYLAHAGQGDIFSVGQSGSVVAIKTPFDRKLAQMSAQLDDTRLYYGDAKARKQQKHKVYATVRLHADASIESRARRATFNLSKSGERNAIRRGGLFTDLHQGKVDLAEVAVEQLPRKIRAMAPAAQQT